LTLDIIIPALNESKNLEVLIPHLKAQLINKHSKIIVVDGFRSSDNTKNICREHDVTYIRCDTCQRSTQMNEGAEKSNADILLFLHADVRLPDGFFELIHKEIKNGKQAGMFAYRFDKDSFLLRINSFFTKYDGLFAGGGDQSLFIKKKIFDDMGGFNDKYVIMEDFDFFKRMKNNNLAYCIIPDKATVSARKYEKNSYLRVNLVNLMAFLSFKLQVSPLRVKETYQKWLR